MNLEVQLTTRLIADTFSEGPVATIDPSATLAPSDGERAGVRGALGDASWAVSGSLARSARASSNSPVAQPRRKVNTRWRIAVVKAFASRVTSATASAAPGGRSSVPVIAARSAATRRS